MFVVSLTYTAPLDRIDRLLDDHKTWLQDGYAAGVFLASGARQPRTGGVILARGDRQALDAPLVEDPFARAGAADYEVTEFVASSVAGELEFLRGL